MHGRNRSKRCKGQSAKRSLGIVYIVYMNPSNSVGLLVFVEVVCQKARKKDEELHTDLVSLQLTQSRLDWNPTAHLFCLLSDFRPRTNHYMNEVPASTPGVKYHEEHQKIENHTKEKNPTCSVQGT